MLSSSTIKPGVPFSGGIPTIAYVNLAHTSLQVKFAVMMKTHQQFLDAFLEPAWNVRARLVVAAKPPPPPAWLMLFVDDADEANSLGFHDVSHDGRPIAKVFVRETLKSGVTISSNTCHELCEMLVDPGSQMWAFNDQDGRLYSYELCDAVEDDEFEYQHMTMCNFVYPSFFESFHKPNSVRFDHLGLVKHPFETRSGGYQTIMEHGCVRDIAGSEEKALRFAQEDRRGHRSEYRKRIAQQWQKNESR